MQLLPRTNRRSGQLGVVRFRAEGAVHTMSVDCGKPRLQHKAFNHLALLGQAIDRGDQPYVFDGGFVDLQQATESEVNSHAPQSHTRDGSAARSRQGQRARPRPPRQTEPFCSGAIEQAFGAEFRALVQHYEALGFEDENGLWVVVKSNPLGLDGPQTHFLVAIPFDRRVAARGWAFRKVGRRDGLFPQKHTNFPDGSICAFTRESRAWLPEDGMTALIDHFSLWAAKSMHRTFMGWWPGPQVGYGALYRRREFLGREMCGCESGKRYSECHQAHDLLVSEDWARQEFKRFFGTAYEDRSAPESILRAAQTRWRELPSISSVF